MLTAANANERLVLEFFATLSDGDLEEVRALLHPETTWTAHDGRIKALREYMDSHYIVQLFA